MKTISLALSALALSTSAVADVIVPGPPLARIKLSKAQVAAFSKAARSAVINIFDFSLNPRPDYLNAAYRSAGKLNIVRVNEVVSVKLHGIS